MLLDILASSVLCCCFELHTPKKIKQVVRGLRDKGFLAITERDLDFFDNLPDDYLNEFLDTKKIRARIDYDYSKREFDICYFNASGIRIGE